MQLLDTSTSVHRRTDTFRRALWPLLAAVLASLSLLAAVSALAAPSNAITRARNLLRGHMYTRFTESGVLGSSLDQRLHLCSNGRFIYDTVSDLPEAGTTTTNRVVGHWRVVSAHFGRDGVSGTARVRGTPDDGSPAITVLFARSARGRITVDGGNVDVARSDLCP